MVFRERRKLDRRRIWCILSLGVINNCYLNKTANLNTRWLPRGFHLANLKASHQAQMFSRRSVATRPCLAGANPAVRKLPPLPIVHLPPPACPATSGYTSPSPHSPSSPPCTTTCSRSPSQDAARPPPHSRTPSVCRQKTASSSTAQALLSTRRAWYPTRRAMRPDIPSRYSSNGAKRWQTRRRARSQVSSL